MDVQVVADTRCSLGEGPLWNQREQKLYWTDIDAGRLYRYDPASGAHETCYEGPKVGGFTFQEDGAMVLLRDKGNIAIYRDGHPVETVVEQVEQEAALAGGRFNDVISDPEGRIFCGTLSDGGGGRLYRLDRDGTLTKVMHGGTVCNGMGFTPDRKAMYFTDTLTWAIWLFDYDQASGGLSGQRLWTRTPEEAGYPDGLTVDAAGRVWSARWDGGAVVRLSPEGRDEQRVEIPARQVTSLTFGGPDYADMYVTTAGGDDRNANGAAAGALLRVRGVGVVGVPEFRSRIGM